MSKFYKKRFELVGKISAGLFALLMIAMNKISGFSFSSNLVISAIIVIAVSIIAFIKTRKSSNEAVSDCIRQEFFLCNYEVSPNIINDFNKYFYEQNKNNRTLNLFLCMLGILSLTVVLLLLRMDFIFVAEISIVLTLLVLFIFNQLKKNGGLSTEDLFTVSVSIDCVMLDGKLTIWNSETKRITDVVFRKINNQAYYLTVFFNSYSSANDTKINSRYLKYASELSDDIIVDECKISIPVPASEKENVQMVVDEMLKIKIKRK